MIFKIFNNIYRQELEELLRSPECTAPKIEQFYQNGVNTVERMLIWKWLLGKLLKLFGGCLVSY